MQKIIPFLWFDHQAEEAANYYVSIFKNAKIESINYYGEGAPMPAGGVMTVAFELEGQKFVALNAGSNSSFNQAISFVVNCETQQEVDYYWSKLTEGGKEIQCGWLTDRYGVPWQITPVILPKLLTDPDPEKAKRVMQAMMQMKKIDIGELERAYSSG